MTTKTEPKPPRTFEQVQQLASNLQRKLKLLAKYEGGGASFQCHAETLDSISVVMGLIGKTPNAHINETALRVLEKEVEDAISDIKGWVKSLFSKEEWWDDEDEDDMIPF